MAPVFARIVNETGARHIVDIGSGSGAPIMGVFSQLKDQFPQLEISLTDRFPNDTAFLAAEKAGGGRIHGYRESVDARAVPENLKGLRAVLNFFHHFNPVDARALLEDAHRKGNPIVLFEMTERRLFRTLTIFPASVVAMLLAVPRMRPLSISAIFFTYFVPAIPLMFGWDGLVSCLRSYRPEELKQLTADLNGRYRWEMGRIPTTVPGIGLTYLLGIPT